MQILSDHTAQQIQGGQQAMRAVGLGQMRQAISLGVRQMNMAINIIIGSGSITNTQINLLGAESIL
jgi:hypothetical protein